MNKDTIIEALLNDVPVADSNGEVYRFDHLITSRLLDKHLQKLIFSDGQFLTNKAEEIKKLILNNAAAIADTIIDTY